MGLRKVIEPRAKDHNWGIETLAVCLSMSGYMYLVQVCWMVSSLSMFRWTLSLTLRELKATC